MKHHLAVLALLLTSTSIAAQAPAAEFPAQLSVDTRQVLTRITDSARAAKLPVEPLVSKAAEGVLKGADDARIIAAVRTLARQLGEARAIMPAGTGTAALTAAASALRAGVTAETLRSLVEAGQGTDAADFGVALVTLADLAANGVPPRTAGDAVSELLRRGTPGRDLAALRSAIAQDIGDGIAPERALSARLRILVPAGPTPEVRQPRER